LPRINYDANGENGALLLEPSRTNQWFNSEYFASTDWPKTNVTISKNSIISPDGTLNASTITDNSTSGEHRIRGNTFFIPSGANFSIFAKAAEYTKFAIANLSDAVAIKFDLSDGTIISVGSGWTNAKIENYGNGWYRLSGSISVNKTCGYALLDDSGNLIFSGDGTKGVHIWGAQFESNATYVSSYIPNHSGTGGVTRAADSCSVTGASDVIGQTEGTLFVDFTFNGNPTSVDYSIMILGSIGSNYITIGGYNTSLYARVFNTTMQGTINAFSMVAGTRYKVALAYANNDVVMYVNGVNEGSDTSASIPAVSQIGFTRPSYGASTDILNSQVYKERLTNAELATLTTL
jgi:hypothetical protein